MKAIRITKQQLRPLAWAIVAAGLCLACFFVVWFQFLRGCEGKTRSVYLNDAYDSYTAPLEQGMVQSQVFTTQGPLYSVGVRFQRLAADVDGKLTVRLIEQDTQQVYMDLTGVIGQVIYDGYTAFALQTPVTDDSTHTWQLEIVADYTRSAGQLALAKSSEAADGFGPLTENGAAAAGSLALQTAVEQLGTTPVKGYWVLAGVCAVLAGVLAVLCRQGRLSKPVLTFAVVLAVGLGYQFVLPAYSAPDEALHYHTAYNLSNQWLGVAPAEEGNNFVQRACDVMPDFTDYRTSAYTYRYLLEHLTDPAPAQTVYVESHEDLMGGYPLPYLLSAIGITLARLLHFGGVATAFFARLWNLTLFAAMAALAVRWAPFAKGLFAAFALLPATLHLAGSFSYDSLLLSLSLPLVALCLQCAKQDRPVSLRQSILLAVLCGLQAPVKSIYLPLCLLVLLIPAGQYATRRSRLATRAGVIGAAGLHFAAYNWLTVYQILTYSLRNAGKVNATHTAARTARTALVQLSAGGAAASAAAVTVSAEAEVGTYSLFYLLQHPGILLKLLCNTFFGEADRYFSSMLGGNLGYLNLAEIQISGLLVGAFFLLLLVGCLPRAEEPRRLAAWQKGLFLLAAVCVLGAVGVVCIYWTPADYNVIWGFQGRYLLPILPCLLLALPLERFCTRGDTFYGVVYAGAMLEILTLLNVLAVVYQR